MGRKNIFSDEMKRCRPQEFADSRLFGSWSKIPSCGKIIHQRVKPDIGNKILIKGQRDTPGESLLGP